MKRSEINQSIKDASQFFKKNSWYLPPDPLWDVTDFGLAEFNNKGLVLINLASEVEYCEKLMYAKKHQTTPEHYHKKKKEDIICRVGVLAVVLYQDEVDTDVKIISVKINGEYQEVKTGTPIILQAGERITIVPYQWHLFYPLSDECIIGEVSTVNDDLNDNFFFDENIGRYPDIEENEDLYIKLISE